MECWLGVRRPREGLGVVKEDVPGWLGPEGYGQGGRGDDGYCRQEVMVQRIPCN